MREVIHGQPHLVDPEHQRAPLSIAYDRGAFAHRLKQPIGTELLARAIRLKGIPHNTIWDLTAGFGYDGVRMASMGHHVTLVERHPTLFEMIKDALQQLPQLIVDNLQLIHADAFDWCPTQHQKPHVIALDPMFPERKKSAAVGNEAQWLQALAGTDDNSVALLTLALKHASHRVVLKRPCRAPIVPHKQHVGSITGKQCRYDLYQPTSII